VTAPCIVMAGGGTGGHVFPLLAVADALKLAAPELSLVFVGTERGLESRLVPERGYALEFVNVKPIRGAGVAGALSGAASAALSLPRARALLKRHSPRLVFSVGGYAAGPLALAAKLLGIPVALLEPNADIGLANRWVAPFVTRAYTAFPETQRFFSERVVLETGVPIRHGFVARARSRDHGIPRLLVLGGSQGARTLNEAVPRAISQLGSRAEVVHQCGAAHEAATRALYAELGLESVARVTPFINDMPEQLAWADLVIGRAGAGATNEICAVGRASLLVPYPFAGDHQRFNALSLERRGAALTVLAADANPERLTQELRSLLLDPERLERMAENARRLGRPDAAEQIARDVLSLSGLASTNAVATAKNQAPGAPLNLQLREVG